MVHDYGEDPFFIKKAAADKALLLKVGLPEGFTNEINKNNMEQLTVKEALEQGYVYYVYSDDGYQKLKDITDVNNIDFDRAVRLVDKNPYHPAGIDKESLMDMIAEHIYLNHESESGDDTDSVYDAIKAIDFDFTDVINKIHTALSNLNYYKAVNIRLVP